MSRTDARHDDDLRETEIVGSSHLAALLFDEVITPLADARRHASASPYFPTSRDAGAATYFVPCAVRAMTAADFDFPGGGTADGLVAAVAAYWTADGEPVLASTAARLMAIAEALRDEAEHDDGSVDIFCYTLF